VFRLFTTKSNLLLILSFYSLGVSAQLDGINNVDFDDLEFINQQESIYIKSDSITYEDVLICALKGSKYITHTEQANLLKKVNNFIDQDLSFVKKSKNLKKSCNKINLKLREEFFKVPKEGGYFSDLINYGEYNTVVAVMLYSYVYEKLNIPFNWLADDNSLYIKPYPNKLELVFSMLPDFTYEGSLSIEDKKLFVSSLQDIMVIPDDEYLNYTVEELYEKYEDDNKTYTAKDLLAINYLLLSYYYQNLEDYYLAYQAIKKGFYLRPKNWYRPFVYQFGYGYLEEDEMKSKTSLEILSELKHYNNHILDVERVLPFLSSFYENHHNSDKEFYYTQMDKFLKAWPNEDTSKRLLQSYTLMDKSKDLYLEGKIHDSYVAVKKAYELGNKTDEDKMRLYNSFINAANLKSLGEATSDLQNLFTKYPDLVENQHFLVAKCNLLLITASEFISRNQYELAEQYINQFEKAFQGITGDLMPMSENLVRSYGRLAVFHYSTDNESKALDLINRALEIDPTNTNLLGKKRMIMNN
jgi:hypothetical protein